DPRFSKILENLRLQKRGTGGVDTAAVGSVFDISNLDRLGKSEVSNCPYPAMSLCVRQEDRPGQRGGIRKGMVERMAVGERTGRGF
ncbi:hypothetical protein chiPu_0025423, partial [Chiloscyllium punctatum]|nr:hypothetical protein [Chiloscyllium punctatum]